MIWVLNRSSKPICESSDRLLERYAMFPDIILIFLRIPFKTYHMYIVCMIARNVKNPLLLRENTREQDWNCVAVYISQFQTFSGSNRREREETPHSSLLACRRE